MSSADRRKNDPRGLRVCIAGTQAGRSLQDRQLEDGLPFGLVVHVGVFAAAFYKKGVGNTPIN